MGGRSELLSVIHIYLCLCRAGAKWRAILLTGKLVDSVHRVVTVVIVGSASFWARFNRIQRRLAGLLFGRVYRHTALLMTKIWVRYSFACVECVSGSISNIWRMRPALPWEIWWQRPNNRRRRLWKSGAGIQSIRWRRRAKWWRDLNFCKFRAARNEKCGGFGYGIAFFWGICEVNSNCDLINILFGIPLADGLIIQSSILLLFFLFSFAKNKKSTNSNYRFWNGLPLFSRHWRKIPYFYIKHPFSNENPLKINNRMLKWKRTWNISVLPNSHPNLIVTNARHHSAKTHTDYSFISHGYMRAIKIHGFMYTVFFLSRQSLLPKM